jgi:hypothetical protein
MLCAQSGRDFGIDKVPVVCLASSKPRCRRNARCTATEMCDLSSVVACRNRAELLRTIAMDCADEKAPALIKVAEYYGRMAAAMERSITVRAKLRIRSAWQDSFRFPLPLRLRHWPG